MLVMNGSRNGRHVVVGGFDSLLLHNAFFVELIIVWPVIHLVVAVVDLILDVGPVGVLVHHEVAVADVLPFVVAATTGVHEEVSDGRGFESELSGDRDLHLLGRSLGFLKNSLKGTALEVRKHQTGFLGLVAVRMVRDSFFPLAR